jgi:transposase
MAGVVQEAAAQRDVGVAKLPPTFIGMEACGAGHYWARELCEFGHEVKLIAPQHVKAYTKRPRMTGAMSRDCARR